MVQYVEPTLVEVGLLRKPGQDEVMMTDRSYVANVYMTKDDKLIRREPAMTVRTKDSLR